MNHCCRALLLLFELLDQLTECFECEPLSHSIGNNSGMAVRSMLGTLSKLQSETESLS